MRVNSRWNQKGRVHTLEDIAATLAGIAWRIAGNGVLELENADFQTDTRVQRLTVIAEFLAFLIHVTDRLSAERVDEETRRRFITALAARCADLMQDNLVDVLGPGDYRAAFIEQLNERMSGYAECAFTDGGPGFGMLRDFGQKVTAVMGSRYSRWIGDRIIDVEAPDAVKTLKKAMRDLFGQADTGYKAGETPR